MTDMERMPVPGAFYRHFKNKLYQIVTLAVHSETGERMVVYQALYGDYKVYVRPLDMFLSPVDREKYPNIEQEYRFERVESETLSGGEAGRQEESPSNALLERFLDASTPEEQLAALRKLRTCATQRDIDCICVALDLTRDRADRSLEEQIDGIRHAILLRQRYDGSRLR